MSRHRLEGAVLGLALLALSTTAAAQASHHVPGWTRSEAERYLGARVRAQKNLTSWGPVLLRNGTAEGAQPTPVGRGVIAGAEGKIVGVEHNPSGSWSIVVEWGTPEFSETYKQPVAWHTPIDRVHYVSAVVEISRPTTPPVKPGHH